MNGEAIFTLFSLFLAGGATGALLQHLSYRLKKRAIEKVSDELLKKAQEKCDELRRKKEGELKELEAEQSKLLEKKQQREREKLHAEEERIKKREERLEIRELQLEKKSGEVERKSALYREEERALENERMELKRRSTELLAKAEELAKATAEEAKELLFASVRREVDEESSRYIEKVIGESKENAEKEAARIVATAINRVAVRCTAESTVQNVFLPNSEIKGRIIGREGRNIRAFERATGVNVVIDETPSNVLLSGFDPVRLYIAKTSLEELINDGRIHPTRIDEIVEEATAAAGEKIKQYGEDAAMRAGITGLHRELILLLGKLKFRRSFGQNILDHSLEVSHIMKMMAAELKLDCDLAKRIGLLHDIGKAVSHEVEGTHALIGRDLALEYGESQEVANGIGCHHFEIEASTIEGSLCHSADAISASRPGARIEAVGEYVKRLKRLEEIAYEFDGVDKAYALQAGRELRIFVMPERVDDSGALLLARELKKRIEGELSYPGKVKISVTRENQFVEYAL